MAQNFKTLVDLWERSTKTHASRPALGSKTADGWHFITYDEFRHETDRCRGGLKKLGITAGDRVAIVSNNRVEWALAAFATFGLRGASA